MTQEKAAEIIDFNAPREAAGVDEAPSAGAFLASVRKKAGFSLFAISDATKVKIEHLEAIEANDTQALPIAAYAIGFVKSYARFLDLNEDELASKFKKDIGANEVMSSAAVPQSSELDPASPHISDGARMVSIFGILAILVFAFWIIFQVTNSPANRGTTGTTAAPEQRVRLGSAPLPTLTPRQITTEAAEEGAPAPSVNENVPVSDTPPPESVVLDSASVDTIAPVPLNNNETIDNVDVAIQSETDEDAAQDVASEVGTETPAVEDALTNSAPSDVATTDDLGDPLPVTTSASAPELNAPAVENLDAIAAPPDTQSRTQIEQIIPSPVIVEAKLLRSIAPQYPNRCARNAADLERVTILFDVTIQGRPANLRVADTSNSCFDSAAVSTLRRWRFEPKTVDGAARLDLAKRATLNFRR